MGFCEILIHFIPFYKMLTILLASQELMFMYRISAINTSDGGKEKGH